MNLKLFIMLGTLCAMPLFAHEVPTDERIKLITYQENTIVPLQGVPFTTTQLVFGEKESIITVECGDSDGWIATFHKQLPNLLFIKPAPFESDTNMTVVTTHHHYYFHLTSNANKDKAKQTYTLKFIYPRQDASPTTDKKPQTTTNKWPTSKVYHWDYTFSGSQSIKPAHVFDDETFTYFELTKNQSVPAVFIVDKEGHESVVNTRQQGDYLVVLRTAPQFTLREGERTVGSVFNRHAIAAAGGNYGR